MDKIQPYAAGELNEVPCAFTQSSLLMVNAVITLICRTGTCWHLEKLRLTSHTHTDAAKKRGPLANELVRGRFALCPYRGASETKSSKCLEG